jgi:hypothetical protein
MKKVKVPAPEAKGKGSIMTFLKKPAVSATPGTDASSTASGSGKHGTDPF